MPYLRQSIVIFYTISVKSKKIKLLHNHVHGKVITYLHLSDEPRSVAHSDEPSSVFASADATPTEPARPVLKIAEECAAAGDALQPPADPGCDSSRGEAPHDARIRSVLESGVCAPSVESYDDSSASGAVSDSRDSDRTRSSEDDVVSVQRVLSRESSTIKENSPASSKDTRDRKSVV